MSTNDWLLVITTSAIVFSAIMSVVGLVLVLRAIPRRTKRLNDQVHAEWAAILSERRKRDGISE